MPPQDSEQARWFAREVLPDEAALRAYLRSQFSTITDPDDVVQETLVTPILRFTRVSEGMRPPQAQCSD
jgi:DNA-directed RNA polymerase specialized sigma24 family protein